MSRIPTPASIVAKLDEAEKAANRHGASNELKTDAAVKFAVKAHEAAQMPSGES